MQKNVWTLIDSDIVIIGNKKYRFQKDIRQFRPTLGVVPIRILVNVDDKDDVQKFIYNADVEVED